MANPTGRGGFRKGKSGNPRGRQMGSRNKATVLVDQLFDEKLFGPDNKAAALIDKAIEMAAVGDTACMRLVFERIAPARKDRPVYFALPDMKEAKDAVAASAAIVSAVAVGELTPSEAAELSKVVDSYARTLQTVELEDRLTKLEKALERAP
jgi:Family of unknown function (DUF5681)